MRCHINMAKKVKIDYAVVICVYVKGQMTFVPRL